MKFETVSTIKIQEIDNKIINFLHFFTFIDVLVNLTELERLDISNNKISTFIHESNISFPRTLTHLYARNNNIYEFPSIVFSNLSVIRIIDIRSNKIQTVELDLLKKINTGLQLFISGK